MKKIGLLIIATNKYINFVKPLIKSANRFFLKNYDVNYFVFTNQDFEIINGVNVIHQEHMPWPMTTLKRYEIFDKNKEILKDMDYLFYCDADMLFVGDIRDEILPNSEFGLVGTEHPGFYGKRRGTYENRKESLAYVSSNEGEIYFAGGFNGGTSKGFLKMCENLSKNIKEDEKNGVVAVWHDESHLNRYFIDNKPEKVLSPSYCYPESWGLPFEKRLLALDKNHNEMRG